MVFILSAIAFVLALFPAAFYFANRTQFKIAPFAGEREGPTSCSILIPARNEERSIRACIEAALATRDVAIEVVVLDDHSTDATAQIVREMAAGDARLRLESAPPLPVGWCGKQHACHILSQRAVFDLLLFIDADLQLSPDAASRSIALLHASGAALVSAFPRQKTDSLLERLLIPMIHVVLLGYLPLREMRKNLKPAMAAGCGQFFLTRRGDYDRAGGHASIRTSMHDGIKLARAYRSAGLKTDIFDGTDIALCHMYRGNVETWRGLEKNAIEGLAAPRAIGLWTVLLMGGHVMPFVTLCLAIASGGHLYSTVLSSIALVVLYAMRIDAALRFRESWRGAFLHPIGVSILIAIQWTACIRHLLGRPARWKGREYSEAAGIASGDPVA